MKEERKGNKKIWKGNSRGQEEKRGREWDEQNQDKKDDGRNRVKEIEEREGGSAKDGKSVEENQEWRRERGEGRTERKGE